MKPTTVKSCLAILLTAVVVHPVQADDNPSDSGKSTARATFDALDKNGDGTIVAEEVKPPQDKAFQQLLRVSDGNKDGSLSLAEFLG
ncbi:MAG: EF-hand domain-containing protein, partial [Planctomycetaceae bacterium]